MKKTTRIAAMIAALTLAACAAVPAMSFSASAEGTAAVTITGLNASVKRTFKVYQVFTGDYDEDEGTFSNVKWGEDVSKYLGTAVTKGNLVDPDILDALSKITDGRLVVEKFALIDESATVVQNEGDELEIEGLADGYYIILDTTDMDGMDDANSAWIVQVAAAEKETSIAIKKETPSVDKTVQDETDDAEEGADSEGFGESADHALYETFQFKLTATIPQSDDFAAYETYLLKFHDAMSSGVTFESIESVKITSATLTGDNAITLTPNQYSETATSEDNKDGLTWDLTINDVKSLVNANNADIFGKEEITVEVIYSAHLNENAFVDDHDRTGTSTDTNYNKVKLVYSNNPDNTGTGQNHTGETPEDYVWVFTYEVDNTKYKVEVKDGNELAGAKFKLYDSTGKTEIGLIYDSTTGFNAYRPVKTGEAAEVMVSAERTGIFNIKGLDAGTYILKEIEAPVGYNKVNDITVNIGATHKEQTDPTKVKLELTGINEGVENEIVDTKNSTLPSTGGIGTKLFVVGGGLAAAMAGVYLVSKKKAKDETAE